MHPVSIQWDTLSASQWQDMTDRQAYCPLQQHYAYGEAMQLLGARVYRAGLFRNDKPIAMAQLLHRRWLKLFPVTLLLRGPTGYPESCGISYQSMMEQLQAAMPVSASRCIIAPPPEQSLTHPFRQVATGEAIALWDIAAATDVLWARMQPKWRASLKQAEQTGLKLTGSSEPAEMQWLLAAEQAKQRERRYRNLPPEFASLYARLSAEPTPIVHLAACHGQEPVAAQLYLLHGNTASYFISWTGEAGRKQGAGHWLLYQAAQHLREKGIRHIDLGQIDTVHQPGLARFKLGTGADILQFPGFYMRMPRFLADKSQNTAFA